MKKNMLLAIRSLPDEYVVNGTEFANCGEWVVAVNGRAGLMPIAWHPNKAWHLMGIDHRAMMVITGPTAPPSSPPPPSAASTPSAAQDLPPASSG